MARGSRSGPESRRARDGPLHAGARVRDYHELWRWSVEDLEGFWGALWDWFEIGTRPTSACSASEMPGAEWFPGATLNYAEHLLGGARRGSRRSCTRPSRSRSPSSTWDELRRPGGALRRRAAPARRGPGDRVAAYMPNVPETVVAFLACASIGAVWSSCAPEFGTPTVVDRFKQIEPKVLIAIEGYRYGGKDFDRRERVAEIVAAIPSIEHTVMVPAAGTSCWPSRRS